jgi:tartrate dehydratase alpha subunit/fumarate hydratase class I-like protein
VRKTGRAHTAEAICFGACAALCATTGRLRPRVQDTGTAAIIGKRGQYVWTDGRDEEALSRGVFRAYTSTNLRYSQVSLGGRLPRHCAWAA